MMNGEGTMNGPVGTGARRNISAKGPSTMSEPGIMSGSSMSDSGFISGTAKNVAGAGKSGTGKTGSVGSMGKGSGSGTSTTSGRSGAMNDSGSISDFDTDESRELELVIHMIQ